MIHKSTGKRPPALSLAVVLVLVTACSSNTSPTASGFPPPTNTPIPIASAPIPVGTPSPVASPIPVGTPSPVASPTPTSTSSPAATPVPLDAASLVTAAMAAEVIGGSPAKISQLSSIVQYALPNGDGLSVAVLRDPGVEAPGYGGLAAQVASGRAQVVDGVGDFADKVVSDAEGYHSAGLSFTKGDVLVILKVQTGSIAGETLEARLEQIAQQIINDL